MSSIAVSSISFAFVFGGALIGMYLRTVVPKDHLSDESRDVVKMGMGLVATMSALVLSLVISSAKNSFDTLNNDTTRISSKIIMLDRTLASFGPESKEARDVLRNSVASVVDRMDSTVSLNSSQLRVSTREVNSLAEKIQDLLPKDDKQRSIQSNALAILVSLQEARWLIYAEESTSISMPMLIILLAWLTALFVSFGLFAPVNGTTITTLSVAALAVSGAIFLISELYSPYHGTLRVSSAPLRAALAQLGN
jgi:hypothetical protein